MTTTTSPDRGLETDVRNGYLARVEGLLERWSLLASEAGAGDSGGIVPAFRNMVAPLAGTLSTDARDWRSQSRLCADGSPIELCETVGPHPHAPAFTCDAGPYGASPATRLLAALGVAEQALEHLPGGPLAVRALAAHLFPPQMSPDPFGLWLGASCGTGTGAARMKIYANLAWRGTADAWQRLERALAALGQRIGTAAREVFAILAARGYPKQLALTVAPTGRIAAKVYYRIARLDLALLAAVAARGEVPDEPFAKYLRRVLSCAPGDWDDAHAGVGVALGAEGDIAGLALYHYARPYFAADADLRRRVLITGADFGWDLGGYRAASLLIDGDAAAGRLRSLVGFGVQAGGETGLHMYARTGHLAA